MLLSEDWFQAGKEIAWAQRWSRQVHLPEATWMTVHIYKLRKISKQKTSLAKTLTQWFKFSLKLPTHNTSYLDPTPNLRSNKPAA